MIFLYHTYGRIIIQKIGDTSNNNSSRSILWHAFVETDGILETNEPFCTFWRLEHICPFKGFIWFFVYLFLQNDQNIVMHLCQVKWQHFFEISITLSQRGHNCILFSFCDFWISMFCIFMTWYAVMPLC